MSVCVLYLCVCVERYQEAGLSGDGSFSGEVLPPLVSQCACTVLPSVFHSTVKPFSRGIWPKTDRCKGILGILIHSG